MLKDIVTVNKADKFTSILLYPSSQMIFLPFKWLKVKEKISCKIIIQGMVMRGK